MWHTFTPYVHVFPIRREIRTRPVDVAILLPPLSKDCLHGKLLQLLQHHTI